MVAGEIEKKYPGPRNKNPHPKITIPIWIEGSRQSSWTDYNDRIEQWPAGDLAHKPLVDYEIDFPGDQFHRPGEPHIVDIPRNPAGLTTVEAEYDRAMIAEGKRDRAEHPERYCAKCDLPNEVCSCEEELSADPFKRAIQEEERERRLDNEASHKRIKELEDALQRMTRYRDSLKEELIAASQKIGKLEAKPIRLVITHNREAVYEEFQVWTDGDRKIDAIVLDLSDDEEDEDFSPFRLPASADYPQGDPQQVRCWSQKIEAEKDAGFVALTFTYGDDSGDN